VGFSAWENGRQFVFQVRDNGPGIARQDLEKIFRPGYTTKSRGSGLGLYICKSIVEGFGGSILVASKPGHGAVFTVEIPWI
jgi:signal transduction histidine kinase